MRLFWSLDDSVVPVARAAPYQENLGGLLTLTTTEVGGHRILDEYIPQIAEFLAAPPL